VTESNPAYSVEAIAQRREIPPGPSIDTVTAVFAGGVASIPGTHIT
jgi:hypothetical protein